MLLGFLKFTEIPPIIPRGNTIAVRRRKNGQGRFPGLRK